MALPALATVAELSAYMQREAPADAAPLALRLASGKVRDFINRPDLPALVDDTTATDGIKAVVLAIAARVVGNPSDIRQDTMGSESLTYATETIGVQLTRTEEKDLRRYRVRFRTLEAGPGETL
ncbi:hypothetical protein [Streptomyces sp. Isolate_219]|uniref:hypothetical protein n=1 Tax=Streptomyces sp. Isolate_219 TaxID=2950110 RepID=UPI0021C859E1|nr:hypothetical protein [Streptomyces sp. Isolate_219]MCR8576469.1 hypothetical protein [Streptomyces sp. Isolate_219]